MEQPIRIFSRSNRIAALFLSFAMSLPSPAYALRVLQPQQDPGTVEALATGIEEKININVAGPRVLRRHLATLNLGLSDTKLTELSQAIAQVVPWRGFKDPQEFVAVLTGKVPGVSKGHLDKIAVSLRTGVSRRTMDFILLGIVGVPLLSAAGLGVWHWLIRAEPEAKPAPSGASSGTFQWYLKTHDSQGYREVAALLRAARKPAVYFGESASPTLEMLEESHSRIARELTGQRLDELIELFYSEGEAAVLATEHGRQLNQILHEYYSVPAKFIQFFRDRPEARRLPLEQLPPTAPVDIYLAENPDATAVFERSPLISFLHGLRGTRSSREAEVGLASTEDERRRGDFWNGVRHEVLETHRRDEPWVLLVRQEIIRRRGESTTYVAQRGTLHHRVRALLGDLGQLGLRVEGDGQPAFSGLNGLKDRHHDAIIRDRRLPIPEELRRSADRLQVEGLLAEIFENGGAFGLVSDELMRQLSANLPDADLPRIRLPLQKNAAQLERAAGLGGVDPQRYDRWRFWAGKLMTAWLRDQKKLTPEMEQNLPAQLRGRTLVQAEQELARNAGAEERIGDFLKVLEEAQPQGPGILVIEASEISRRTGLEEFAARVPRLGRKIVLFGRNSASAKEAAARNGIPVVDSDRLEDLAAYLTGAEESERVGYVGDPERAGLLSLILPAKLQVTPFDPDTTLSRMLAWLGYPAALLDAINAAGAEELFEAARAA